MQMKEAVQAVLNNHEKYEVANAYYEGDVPEVFATAKLRAAFRTTGDPARMNYCRTIVHAVSNRLEIGSIVTENEQANNIIKNVIDYNDMTFEMDDTHRLACAHGDRYAIVWPDELGEWEVSFHSPKNVGIVYDPENPRRKRYGVHLWQSGSNEHRMDLLYADKIAKYKSYGHSVTDGTQWIHMETVENPFGAVPVFHFRTQRPFGRPEHFEAYDCQNAINKLFITNMHTIDYQGAPTRYALTQMGDAEIADFEDGETDRDNLDGLRNGPGELWYLKGVHQVGQFEPAKPEAFWTPIEKILRSMSVITDTPAHYFDRTGNNPTGNGLRTAEAPLLKKIEDRKASFGATWRELFTFILRAEGVVAPVTVVWKTNETLDELERWDVSLKKINAGLSHRQALREGGYTESDIEKIMAERQAEAEAGLYYTRAPQTRVNTDHDETQEVEND
jgi:hypothetical protein